MKAICTVYTRDTYGLLENIDGIVTGQTIHNNHIDVDENNIYMIYKGLSALAKINPSIPLLIEQLYYGPVIIDGCRDTPFHLNYFYRTARPEPYVSYSETVRHMSIAQLTTVMWQVIYTLLDAYYTCEYRTDFSSGIDRILLYDMGKDAIFTINYTFGVTLTCFRYLAYIRPLSSDSIVLESNRGLQETVYGTSIDDPLYSYIRVLLITIKSILYSNDTFSHYNYIRHILRTIWPDLIDVKLPECLLMQRSVDEYIEFIKHTFVSSEYVYSQLNIPYLSINSHMFNTQGNVTSGSIYSYICRNSNLPFKYTIDDIDTLSNIYALRPQQVHTEIVPERKLKDIIAHFYEAPM